MNLQLPRMPKRKTMPDRPRDVSQLAKRIVAISTEQENDSSGDAPSAEASRREDEGRKSDVSRAEENRRKGGSGALERHGPSYVGPRDCSGITALDI